MKNKFSILNAKNIFSVIINKNLFEEVEICEINKSMRCVFVVRYNPSNGRCMSQLWLWIREIIV